MLKVAPCTAIRSYNQIFSAWWVTTILYNYGATLCELCELTAIIQPYFADNMHNDTAGNSNSYVFLKTQIYNFHLVHNI